MDVATLADLLHETAEHHDHFEKIAPKHDWWDWYAPYLDARLQGRTSDEAVAAADRYMKDVRHIVPRFTPAARKANQALVDLLGEIATGKQATPAQIAIGWLLARKPWIVPIPGTTKLHRLEENIGAAAIELTPDDLREIESAVAKIAVQGDRYPEKLEKMTGL